MDDLKPGDIVPGRVVVGLKEVYSGDPAELFTYLEIKSIEDMYLSVIISSGKTPEEVKADSERDRWLTAEEAKAYGLIDKVIYKR